MGQVEKERKHAQIQQEDTRAMKRPVTKRRLCLRKQSSGFIPGASSLHVEASMGKTLNPKLLPAAVCVQSQWRRVWTNGLPQRPTVTSLNTNYSGGENNTEPTQIGGSVLLPYMLQPSLHQEQNHGDATWRSPRTRTCTLCRYKRLNTRLFGGAAFPSSKLTCPVLHHAARTVTSSEGFHPLTSS
uniref:uncharacterized protein LOC117270754 isoform X2 n=1 Tax=Epinephelus lanceolatus TaxID=310571 RepID=UPI001447A57D|nr:uncharacterized protein LOC117270754 isoform X2 [Epinephelus lanceolatus]